MEDPENYLRGLSGLSVDNRSEKIMFSHLHQIRRLLDSVDIDQLKKQIYEIRNSLNAMAEDFMTELRKSQSENEDFLKIKQSLKIKKNQDLFLEKTTKQLLMAFSKNRSPDWPKVELWLNTYNEWLIRLTRDTHSKLKNNDFNDLMNLIYVKPGQLYWTLDERKTVPLIHESGNGHYLL